MNSIKFDWLIARQLLIISAPWVIMIAFLFYRLLMQERRIRKQLNKDLFGTFYDAYLKEKYRKKLVESLKNN